jgi:thioesterase domain-containing protein
MAERLAAAGRRVALVLLDSHFDDDRTLDDHGLLARFISDFALQVEGSVSSLAGFFQEAPRADRLEPVLAALQRAGICPAEMDAAQFRRRFDVFRANHRAAGGFAVKWDGPALVVGSTASAVDPGYAAAWRGQLSHCQVATIEGDHYSILRPPSVADVARLVRDHFLAAI